MAMSDLTPSSTRTRGTWMAVAVAPLVLTAGLLAGCGPPAQGTVTASNGGMIFTAASGKANDVTVTAVDGGVEISDAGDTITPGDGCTAVDTDTARCGGVVDMALDLKDGDDQVANDTNVPTFLNPSGPASGINGGPGNDVLNGGTSIDRLSGDEGTDTLNGRGGQDLLFEGSTPASTDDLDADTFSGGDGTDQVLYVFEVLGVVVDLDGVADDGREGEGDNVGSDVERVAGGAGDDTLRGSAGNDVLLGAGGTDTLLGLGGNDSLLGESGNDILEGGVGNDRLAGGPENDLLREGSEAAEVDALDADIFDGGSGVDMASYRFATASVRVTLDDVADDGRQAPLEGDNVQSEVENVTGGGGNDSLFGDADANRLIGNAGVDVISADAGDDFLRGGTALDSLDGGEGTADDCDAGPVGPDGGSEFNCEI